MKRREFITVLGGAAAWPLTARAQQVRRIGVIIGFADDDEVWHTYLETFRQRLQEFGWTERDNIRFHYRFAESTERMRIAGSELLAMYQDVIFITDSVGSGYVATLSPGVPITGFRNYAPALGAKWMGIQFKRGKAGQIL